MKKLNSVLIGGLLVATLTVPMVKTFSLFVKTSSSQSFSITVSSGRQAGYYLYWNDATEPIKMGDKVDTELVSDVTVAEAGEQTFRVVDEYDVPVSGASGTVSLDILGDFRFCFKNGSTYSDGTSDHTYMYYNTYYTDSNSWGSNLHCYLYNGEVNNTWPGNNNVTIEYVKDNDYGQKIYKTSINAKKYGTTGSYAIFNNNNQDQTVDINLVSKITANQTGIYIDNGDTSFLTVDARNLSWWKDGNAVTLAYYFGGSGDPYWTRMSNTYQTTKYVGGPVDRTKYSKVAILRTNETGTSGTGWPSCTVYNQTVDLTIPSSYQSTCVLQSAEEGSKKTATWEGFKHSISTYSYK